jgi:hypothetical protein
MQYYFIDTQLTNHTLQIFLHNDVNGEYLMVHFEKIYLLYLFHVLRVASASWLIVCCVGSDLSVPVPT